MSELGEGKSGNVDKRGDSSTCDLSRKGMDDAPLTSVLSMMVPLRVKSQYFPERIEILGSQDAMIISQIKQIKNKWD